MDNHARIDASQFPGKNGGEQIQAAIDSWGTKPKVIEVGPQGPDLDGRWFLTKAIIIPSNTTLVLHGSRLFMADKVSDNMIRNSHAETGDSRRDENIHILGLGGAELDGNAVNQVRQAQVYKNFGITFHKVDKASIKGIVLGPTEAWGMGLENVNDLFIESIRFQQDGKTENQDGVHVCGPNGQLLEMACFKFIPPEGHTYADVLGIAHRMRVEAGEYAIADKHLADAIAELTEQKIKIHT